MTPPNRGVFPITIGAIYELIDGRQFMAVTCPESFGGVVFVSRDARTTLVLRESTSGDAPVTALDALSNTGAGPDCGRDRVVVTPSDFTLWDLEERSRSGDNRQR